MQASDAWQVKTARLQDLCDGLKSELAASKGRWQASELAAKTTVAQMQLLRDENSGLKERLGSLTNQTSHLKDQNELMRLQLDEFDAQFTEVQQTAKAHEDAAMRLQVLFIFVLLQRHRQLS